MAFIKASQRNFSERSQGVISWTQWLVFSYFLFPRGLLNRSPGKCTFPSQILSECTHNWHSKNDLPHIIAYVSCQSILWVTSQFLWLGHKVNVTRVTGWFLLCGYILDHHQSWVMRPKDKCHKKIQYHIAVLKKQNSAE